VICWKPSSKGNFRKNLQKCQYKPPVLSILVKPCLISYPVIHNHWFGQWRTCPGSSQALQRIPRHVLGRGPWGFPMKRKRKIYIDTSVISHFNAPDVPNKMADTWKLWQLFEQDSEFEPVISVVIRPEKLYHQRRLFREKTMSRTIERTES
jgi:hypothetical protein